MRLEALGRSLEGCWAGAHLSIACLHNEVHCRKRHTDMDTDVLDFQLQTGIHMFPCWSEGLHTFFIGKLPFITSLAEDVAPVNNTSTTFAEWYSTGLRSTGLARHTSPVLRWEASPSSSLMVLFPLYIGIKEQLHLAGP